MRSAHGVPAMLVGWGIVFAALVPAVALATPEAVPDWVVKPLATNETKWVLARAMEPAETPGVPEAVAVAQGAADRTARVELETAVDAIFRASAIMLVRPPSPDGAKPTPEEIEATAQKCDAVIAEIIALTRQSAEILDRYVAENPGNAPVAFSLAGVDFSLLRARFTKLIDEQFPERPAQAFSAADLLTVSRVALAQELHKKWLPTLPEWVREPGKAFRPTDFLSKRHADSSEGTLNYAVRIIREYGDGVDFSGPELGLAGLLRVDFHTDPEPWKSGTRLQTQITGGLRVPIDDNAALFALVAGTIASDVGPATFDHAILGIKFNPLGELVDRPEIVEFLGASIDPLSLDFFVTALGDDTRGLALNAETDVVIDFRASVAFPLRMFLDLGMGLGDEVSMRIQWRITAPLIPIYTDSPLGMILVVAGLDMEWRIGGTRNLDRYDFLLTIETLGPNLLLRWRVSGELGHQWTAGFGWMF